MNQDKASNAARRLFQCTVLLLVALPISALGTRFGLWPYTVGLPILLASMAGSFIIQIIHSCWLLRKPAPATKKLLRRCSLLAMPPLLIAAVLIHSGGTLPMIHDISTDTTTPPSFITANQQRSHNSNSLIYSEDKAKQQRSHYPHIKTLHSPLSVEQAFERALNISAELNWQVYSQQPLAGHIEAVDTTRWFGFSDDIVIRIEADTAGSKLDIRSVSRVGTGDFGANARRIEQFSHHFTASQ